MESIRLEEGNSRANENSKGQAGEAFVRCFGPDQINLMITKSWSAKKARPHRKKPRLAASGGTKPCSVSGALEWWFGLR